MVIVGAMMTPDGRVKVEAVRRLGMDWYRVVHDDQVVADYLVVGVLEKVLRQRCGIELSSLVELPRS